MKGLVLAALLGAVLSACGGGSQIGAPGTGEVWIKHRVPSK